MGTPSMFLMRQWLIIKQLSIGVLMQALSMDFRNLLLIIPITTSVISTSTINLYTQTMA